jgi:4-amino-4-deoxy-L-arabinose transferase-like glycosyltransferase
MQSTGRFFQFEFRHHSRKRRKRSDHPLPSQEGDLRDPGKVKNVFVRFGWSVQVHSNNTFFYFYYYFIYSFFSSLFFRNFYYYSLYKFNNSAFILSKKTNKCNKRYQLKTEDFFSFLFFSFLFFSFLFFSFLFFLSPPLPYVAFFPLAPCRSPYYIYDDDDGYFLLTSLQGWYHRCHAHASFWNTHSARKRMLHAGSYWTHSSWKRCFS